MWCGAAMSSIFCCTDAVSQVVESPKKFSKSQCRERFGTTAQIYVGIQSTLWREYAKCTQRRSSRTVSVYC